MHSGSLNHIYASLAHCIMCVQALFHAHNINSFALLSPSPSSMALYAFRLSEPYMCQLSSFALCVFRLLFTHIISTALLSSLPLPPQWLYTHSGSLNHIYASLARCIMCVQAPFHAHNINSFTLLSLSLLNGFICIQAL